MEPKRWVFPVSYERLIWCQAETQGYKESGNLEVSALAKDEKIARYLRLLSLNYLTKQQVISANIFRESAGIVIREMIVQHILKEMPLHTRIGLFPWRAGLAYLHNFASLEGVSQDNLYYLGASRDEKTLRTKIYFEEPAPLLVKNKFGTNEIVQCYVMDPMLATGNTTATAIERLCQYRIGEVKITDAMITVLSLFAAPEGVVRLLKKYPNLNIITAILDDHLDKNGFIVPGCGDFGDQYFAGLNAEHFKDFRIFEWFSPHAWEMFKERMRK